MSTPNRIKTAAEARRQHDADLRPEVAQAAEEVWGHLEPQLRLWASAPSTMGLIIDFLVERARAYRHECEIEVVKEERLQTLRHLSAASYKGRGG